MSESKMSFQEDIAKIISDSMNDSDFIEKTIRKNVEECITSTVENMFNWGDAKRAIQQKLTEVMLPAIKSHDFSSYVQKLDIVLTELINSPNVICNNKILSNFKTIIAPPNTKTITLDQLFDKYCEFIAENFDTEDRDINYDNGKPAYDPVSCIIESKRSSSPYTTSDAKHYTVSFHVDEHEKNEDEYGNPLNFDITLYRWHFMPENTYAIRTYIDPYSIQKMSSFEAFLYSLSVANIDVTMPENFDSESFAREFIDDRMVELEKEPEATYQ